MKKIAGIIFLLTLISAGSAFATDNFGLRILTEASIDFTGMDFYDDEGEFSWDAIDVQGVSPVYWGLTWSMAFDRFGMGTTAQVNFDGSGMDTVMEFDYSLFMTVHFFKTNRAVDWFIEAGLGVGGLLDFNKIYNYSDYDYDWDSDGSSSYDFMELAVYPHLATGIAIKPGRSPFTFGGKITVRPLAGKIPVAPLKFHETSLFEASLFIGLTFNFDRKAHREKEEQEDREDELRDKYEDLLDEKDNALEELEDEIDDLEDELEDKEDEDEDNDDGDDGDERDEVIEKSDDESDEEDFQLTIEEIKETDLDDWRSDEAKELEEQVKEAEKELEEKKQELDKQVEEDLKKAEENLETIKVDININVKQE